MVYFHTAGGKIVLAGTVVPCTALRTFKVTAGVLKKEFVFYCLDWRANQ